MQIKDNIYTIPGVVCNIYVIVEADGLTLIDTGLPRTQKKTLAYLAGLGKSARDIKRILITHADIDHVGGLAALQKASGARTYAGRIEAEAIAAGRPSRVIRSTGFSLRRLMFALLRPFMKVAPFQVDEIVSDGQSLPVLGGLTVLETPGHTPGHLSYYAAAAGVLFCGDSLVVDGTGQLLPSRPGITWDRAAADASVRRQAALGARIVCSGHGPVAGDAQGKFPQV